MVIFLAGPDWSFLVTPTLAGALVIVALGIAYNNLWADRAAPSIGSSASKAGSQNVGEDRNAIR